MPLGRKSVHLGRRLPVRRASDVDVLASGPGSRFALDAVIERVALDGNSAGLGDQAADLGDGRFLRRLGAGFVVDLFVDDSAVQDRRPRTTGRSGPS